MEGQWLKQSGHCFLGRGTSPRMVVLRHHHCHCLLCLHLACQASLTTNIMWTTEGTAETLLVRHKCSDLTDTLYIQFEIVTFHIFKTINFKCSAVQRRRFTWRRVSAINIPSKWQNELWQLFSSIFNKFIQNIALELEEAHQHHKLQPTVKSV